MNLDVLDNKIVKLESDKNYYSCDWSFKLRCICDLCVKDRLLRSPKIDLTPLSTNCCLQIQLKSPSVFQICNANVQFDDFGLKLSVKNKNNVKCYNREYSNLSTHVTQNYLNAAGKIENDYTLQFLNSTDIQNCNYILNGVLTINVTVFKPANMISAPITRKVLNFQLDMKNLQQNETFSDVTLVVGEQKFHVHKAILASRSSVFLAMFDTEMAEKIEREVVIEDTIGEVMKHVLNYMYTEMMDEKSFKNIAYGVLMVAHKYAITGLIDICEVALVETLNVNNAFKFLLVADTFMLDLLKKAAIGFIIRNAKDLVETDEFKKFIYSSRQNWLKDIILAFG